MNTIQSNPGHLAEEEQRSLGRVDARIGEGIAVSIKFSDLESPVKFAVRDYSMQGLGVELSDVAAGIDLERVRMEENTVVELDFRLSADADNPYRFACKICSKRMRANKLQLGLIMTGEQTPTSALLEQKALALPASLNLAGLIDHPFLYDQTSLLKIEKISRECFVATSADLSFVVFPSMPVIFSLNLFSGNEPIHGRVMRAEISPEGVRFAVHIDRMSESTQKGIVQFVMQFLDIEPLTLKRAGFNVSDIKSIINYRLVRTQNEYVEVLKLRRAAYSAAGKISKDVDLSAVSYFYDDYSRKLTAWHHDRLVGAVNILFADGKETLFEVQKLISPEDFARLPPPSEMVEVAALCVHREYRKSDVLIGLFERIFQVLVTSGKSYIVAGSDGHLWKIYENIGFVKMGIKYKIPKYGNLEHDVIIVNKRVGACGLGLEPMRWNKIYRNISDHLSERGILEKSPTYRIVSPVYKAYIDAVKGLQERNIDVALGLQAFLNKKPGAKT